MTYLFHWCRGNFDFFLFEQQHLCLTVVRLEHSAPCPNHVHYTCCLGKFRCFNLSLGFYQFLFHCEIIFFSSLRKIRRSPPKPQNKSTPLKTRNQRVRRDDTSDSDDSDLSLTDEALYSTPIEAKIEVRRYVGKKRLRQHKWSGHQLLKRLPLVFVMSWMTSV